MLPASFFVVSIGDTPTRPTLIFQGVSVSPSLAQRVAGAGKTDVNWEYVIRLSDGRVELFFGSSDGELNKSRFDYLLKFREEIESKFGKALVWNYKEGRKQHYIRSWCKIGGLKDKENWDEIQEDLVNKMKAMVDSIGPYIKQLP
jgi:hypothetical protein